MKYICEMQAYKKYPEENFTVGFVNMEHTGKFEITHRSSETI